MTGQTKDILWLDDKPMEIRKLIQAVKTRLAVPVKVVEEGTAALELIASPHPPDVLVIDLQLNHGGDNGFEIAKTAKSMDPSLQIIAVTEHFPEFQTTITDSLLERNYPFSQIWEKDTLDSKKHIGEFVSQVERCLNTERLIGYITEVDSEYTRVRLDTESGEEVDRYFETPFLSACGIGQVGTVVEVAFSKIARNHYGLVTMTVMHRNPEYFVEESRRRVETVMASIDMERIRTRFGHADTVASE